MMDALFLAGPGSPASGRIGRRDWPREGRMARVVRLEGGEARLAGVEGLAPGVPLFADLAPEPALLELLGERFGFHPLALEDCAQEGQRTKLDAYPGTLFLVLHRIGPTPEDDGLQLRELHIFLTHEALVTVHTAGLGEVDAVFERCARNPDLLARGPDHVLYLLLDALTDAHLALADALADDLEDLVEEVVGGDGRDTGVMPRLLDARRTHALLRRSLAPQRDLLASLQRPAEGLVRPATSPYFRDVLDHLLHVNEEIDVGRDLLASAMDVQLNLANNRLNLVMARLTVVTVIFLPLNFLVGWFGMNLEILPAALARPLVVVSSLLFPPALWWWFRLKRLL